ncbi:NADPH-dependent F420 reductase [Tessaracoccus flavescens]|uniref:Diguanylate cyclase n=1 Tax=Tessaracoccus flavescens TaxID=399497 RepID=A0A1Q2CX46_9ACTN|nr:NADPH-dependent F420 reductase [Tessaracoccus flavescens]AQP50695.1 diguanylate cyclase [Tessaracoccus flavescens]
MSKVTIIGGGNMGKAISELVTKGGNTVEILTRSDASTAVTGEIVVLAVPYGALGEIVAQRGDELAGKVVVDITNPLDFQTFDGLVVPADGSAAAELAAKLPRAKVVKAFNTNFAATLGTGKVGENTTTVLVAGDDADAKQGVVSFVKAAGLNALDVGSLKRARELEAIGFTQLVLAGSEQIGWTGGFAVVA